jgi:hypothetical protein
MHAGTTAPLAGRFGAPPDWQPPPLADREVLAQVHCHQHAFGFQPGHADASQALAEQVLLPRLRDADPAAVILADGFSCRTQVHELDSGGREAIHLAELLAAAQAGHLPAAHPERHAARRPAAPGRAGRLAASAGVLAAAGMAAGAAAAVAARGRARR